MIFIYILTVIILFLFTYYLIKYNKPCKPNTCTVKNSINPKYCNKPVLSNIVKTSICKNMITTNKDSENNIVENCISGSKSCALELLLGNSTHMTIAYICNCDNTVTLISDLLTYIKKNWKKTTIINITLGNMLSGFFEENSRCIIGLLADLKSFVMDFAKTKGYCLTEAIWGGTPHTQVLWSSSDCRTPNKTINILNPENWIISR